MLIFSVQVYVLYLFSSSESLIPIVDSNYILDTLLDKAFKFDFISLMGVNLTDISLTGVS